MFCQKGGGRSGVSKIAVVITDGRSQNMLRTIIEASITRRHGVHLFTIGVGPSVNYVELRGMASRPTSMYLFHVAGYSALDALKKRLAIKTCQGITQNCDFRAVFTYFVSNCHHWLFVLDNDLIYAFLAFGFID